MEITHKICAFDIEATGLDVSNDRVVEVCFLVLTPEGGREAHTYLINPGIPIPKEATEIHGITDEDVKDAPSFKELAAAFYEHLTDAHWLGFNLKNFDAPMIRQEFKRHAPQFRFPHDEVVLIDPMVIFQRKEPRNLEAAVRYYLNREHVGAHGAKADIEATVDVWLAQMEKYEDLPREPKALYQWCFPANPNFVGPSYHFQWNAKGEVIYGFGKHKGKPFVGHKDKGYRTWILNGDFPDHVKEIVEKANEHFYPVKESGKGEWSYQYLPEK